MFYEDEHDDQIMTNNNNLQTECWIDKKERLEERGFPKISDPELAIPILAVSILASLTLAIPIY